MLLDYLRKVKYIVKKLLLFKFPQRQSKRLIIAVRKFKPEVHLTCMAVAMGLVKDGQLSKEATIETVNMMVKEDKVGTLVKTGVWLYIFTDAGGSSEHGH